MGQIALDASGNSEKLPATYNFVNNLPANDVILTSPAPSFSQIVPTTPPNSAALTFGTITVSGTVVTVVVSATGAKAGAVYDTTCYITTQLGYNLVCNQTIEVIGP